MEFRGAVASHVGNVRDTNQDRVHFGGFVAAVADGMGGHQGGETAASIAINEFRHHSEPIAPGGLVEIVEDANRAVFERAADPDLRGMGTTLVALTLRPNERAVNVVNVGDSRAYFLHGGELGQLTLDHSLVEDLVRQGRLEPEEALTHPQRNILTRALGISSEVEVDRFLQPVEIGDRFLLCSDGLFNEVGEDEIVQILLDHPEPNAAADTLVAAALSRAARDNVTVAVVDVVENGQGADVSTAETEPLKLPGSTNADVTVEAPGALDPNAAPSGPAPIPDPEAAPGEIYREDDDFGGGATEGFDPSVTVVGSGGPGAQVGGPGGGNAAADPNGSRGNGSRGNGALVAPRGGGDTQPAPDVDLFAADTVDVAVAEAPRELDTEEIPQVSSPTDATETMKVPDVDSGRGSRLRNVLFGLVILGVLGSVAYFGGTIWARSTWFVGEDADGTLAIYNGHPGIPLLQPDFVEAVPDKSAGLLDDNSLARYQEQPTHESLAAAREFAEGLRQEGDVNPDDLPEADPTTVTGAGRTTTTTSAETTVSSETTVAPPATSTDATDDPATSDPDQTNPDG